MQKSLLVTAISAIALSGCASPEVVDTRQVGDSALSCTQIKNEIAEAQRFEDAAREEKGVTGTNVAAAVFFWPAMLVTHSNANEAIDAAKERKANLIAMGQSKGCAGI